MKNKIILFLLISIILLISGISIHSEGSDIEFRLIEYFRNDNLSGIEKIIKGGKVQKEFVLLYEGQVAVLKRDYEGADKYFSEVMKYIKDKENRIYIVAEYLQEMMRLNEGFTWYKKKLINDYISHLETAKRKDVSYINRVKAYRLSEELLYIEPANTVHHLLYGKAALTIGFAEMPFVQIDEILFKYPPENMDTFCETLIALADSFYYIHQKYVNNIRINEKMIAQCDRCFESFQCEFHNCFKCFKGTTFLIYAKRVLKIMLSTSYVPKKYKKIAAKKLKGYNDNYFNMKKSKAIFLKEAIKYAKSVNKNMDKD